jgi:hypothetical protein
VGGIALIASGCGGTAADRSAIVTPASIVRRDLARIATLFAGWQAHTFTFGAEGGLCRDTDGGTPAASIEGEYKHPSDPPDSVLRLVNAAVEYRSPINSRRFVAAFGRPGVLRCYQASEVKYWRSGKPRSKPPFPQVRVTAGLPRALAEALGRRASGYQVRIIPFPGDAPHFYDLRFVYRDASDPHVVYHVVISDSNRHLEAAASLARRIARRVIRTTG